MLKKYAKNLSDRLNRTAEELSIIGKTKAELVRGIEPCKRLLDLEGVGEVCSAMLYSSLGNGSEFKNGRQASVYIGLTPKQHSSGGKTFITGIDN